MQYIDNIIFLILLAFASYLFAKNIDQSIIRTNDKREEILQYFKERITLQPKPLIENIIDNF
jgi:hypothetical protein